MKKRKTRFVCQSCGYESPRWMGKCPDCQNWNSFVEEQVESQRHAASPAGSPHRKPTLIGNISQQDVPRILTGISEFDRVLGGGMVPGSVILIGGAPGIGKSTLLLQVCARLASSGKKVLYISGEESLSQIKIRADRLKVGQHPFQLMAETDVHAIQQTMENEKPDLVIVDSIQTVFSGELDSMPGNISQVRFSGHQLTSAAKTLGVAMFMVGHVNKEGSIAGPRVLEHLVDALLLMEGDHQHQYRLLRGVKNRFGSTNEIGIFEMTDAGIQEVKNPSKHLISERRQQTAGTAVAVSLEGTRPLLVEMQALVTGSSYGMPQRTCMGVDHRKLNILLAILEKRLGFRFGTQDVFVSAAGGLKLSEPGIDLSLIAALVSSLKDHPLDAHTAFVGEVGLTGEVRSVTQIENRITEAQRLGFTKIWLPQSVMKGLQQSFKIKLLPCETVRQAVNGLFNE